MNVDNLKKIQRQHKGRYFFIRKTLWSQIPNKRNNQTLNETNQQNRR